MKYPVLLMESVQKIAQGFQSLLTDKDKKKLAGYMQKLGFDDVAGSFYELQSESGKRVNSQTANATLSCTCLLGTNTTTFSTRVSLCCLNILLATRQNAREEGERVEEGVGEGDNLRWTRIPSRG